MTALSLTGLTLAAAVVLCSQIASGAEILGRVTDSKGKGIEGALVSAHLKVAPQIPEPPTGDTTDSTGSFTLRGAKPGHYTVCVAAPGGAYIDPCAWSLSPPEARLLSNDAQMRMTIPLDEGERLRIDVDDPEKILPTPARPNTGTAARLEVGVWTAEGFFYPFRLAASERFKHRYELLVPRKKDLKLTIAAENMKVLGANGRPIDPDSKELLRVEAKGRGPGIRRLRVAP